MIELELERVRVVECTEDEEMKIVCYITGQILHGCPYYQSPNNRFVNVEKSCTHEMPRMGAQGHLVCHTRSGKTSAERGL